MAEEAPGPIGRKVRVVVGPVTRASAVAWFTWAEEVCGELGTSPSRGCSSPPLLVGAGGYLEQWKRPDVSAGGTFRWRAEVDPDELEYLIHALLGLDAHLAVDTREGRASRAARAGREFYVVLVRDLLHALEMEGTGRAAFADQLRCGWPSAAEAS